MGSMLAKTYVVLSGAILVVVGVVGFFRQPHVSSRS
jgi:multisubunit Na+/H+ antiporter MnhG subunit